MIKWNLRSNVADVLSLGPRTSAKLLRLGVQTVEHLLVAKPHLLSVRLADERINWKTISCWQREAQLILVLPELGSQAVRTLALADFFSAQQLAQSSPTALLAKLEQLVADLKETEGMASVSLPDFVEVSRWIECAQTYLRNCAA